MKCLLNNILHDISETMRPLTEEETKVLFEKLNKYIGDNIKLLLDRGDGAYCFRLHKDRVYYVSEKIMRQVFIYVKRRSNLTLFSKLGIIYQAANVARENLVSLGTCFGKFTKTRKFRLHITALAFLAPYAQHKIWVKAGAEQQFLYGHHVMKSGLGRITENTPKYQGVIVYSMKDLPLGFGVAAKATGECRNADPMNIIAFHQADLGEYIRAEETLL